MTKNKTELLGVWNNVWYVPGWFRLLEMTGDYDSLDLLELEKIDQEIIETDRERERYYKETEMPKVRIQEKEFVDEFSRGFRNDERLKYLNPRIVFLENEIEEIWKDFNEAVSRDIPYWLRETSLGFSNPDSKAKKLRSLTVEKYLILNPKEKKKNWVSPEEIIRALDFPFDQLIAFNKAGFALCPFHKEKSPSFHLIKLTNKAHCFGCNWHGDPINFLREQRELSFQEAVRALCK